MVRTHCKNFATFPPEQILDTWSKDRNLDFGAIVDGWIIPEQPATIFAEGRQARVSVLIGSNSDEATVFGHNHLKTIDQYKKYLREGTGRFVDQELSAYPVASDSEVPARYLQLQNDFFAYGAWSLARAMTRIGQTAYLYYFTFAETGKRASLGAYHGEELNFVSNSFPTDWQHNVDDEKLGQAMRTYWTQFVKTGNPNTGGLPVWPVYDPSLDQRFELGRTIGVRPVAPELRALQHIMEQIFAETASARMKQESN